MMPEEDLLQHPIHDRRPAWHWQREEKVVLLGDAAHPLTPNLGQGAAMALEDAWELAALWGKPDAMTRFERRRRMRLLLLWAASRHIGKLIQWDHPALCWLRDTQMRLTPDTLHTAMMRRLLRYVPSEVARL
jgi:2-heptyl-3-hydroxy-4(1H)-quinolone synthase